MDLNTNETNSLLIYIPTYNRYERLCEQLDVLLPYLSKYNIHIIVSNNASTDQRYSNLHLHYLHANFSIITNNINIGGNPNIFNGFIHSPPYDYLWILSDDDTLLDNSIDSIMSLLDNVNDIIYLTNRETGIRKECYGLNDIIEILNYGLGLISCVIYRTKIINSEIYKGYDYIISGFPHLALLFSACNSKEKIKIMQYPAEKILDLKRPEPPSVDFPTLYSLYGSVHLADFLEDKQLKDTFLKWIIYENIWNIMRYRKQNSIRYNDFKGYIFVQSFSLYGYFLYQKMLYHAKKQIYDLFSHINGGPDFLVNLDQIVRLRKKWTLFPKINSKP